MGNIIYFHFFSILLFVYLFIYFEKWHFENSHQLYQIMVIIKIQQKFLKQKYIQYYKNNVQCLSL